MASLVVSDPKLTLASDGKFLPEIVSGGRLCSAKASARRDVDVDPELTPPRGEKFFPGIVSGDRYDCCPRSSSAHRDAVFRSRNGDSTSEIVRQERLVPDLQ